jgi:hypothetical protein
MMNANTAVHLKVGDVVVVNTCCKRKGQTGVVQGFTAKKIRVLFSDKTTQTYFGGSLIKAHKRQEQNQTVPNAANEQTIRDLCNTITELKLVLKQSIEVCKEVTATVSSLAVEAKKKEP